MVMLTIDMMYRPENSLERLFTVTFGGIGTGLLVYGSTVVVQLALQWQASKFDTYRRVRTPLTPCVSAGCCVGAGGEHSSTVYCHAIDNAYDTTVVHHSWTW